MEKQVILTHLRSGNAQTPILYEAGAGHEMSRQ